MIGVSSRWVRRKTIVDEADIIASYLKDSIKRVARRSSSCHFERLVEICSSVVHCGSIGGAIQFEKPDPRHKPSYEITSEVMTVPPEPTFSDPEM